VLEVEIKFTDTDHAALAQRLAGWGAREAPPLDEADHYFNAPDRDFARTDEAFRLRRIGTASFITYKGPKRDAATKTRTEVEVPLAEGPKAAEDFLRLVVHLGYHPVAVVRKRRRIFRLERGGFPVEVCLDEVEGLGPFAELEIQAPEEQLPAARAALLELAAELGLTASERRSYLELLLAARKERSP
jgi:adenylate cyclase class 2